MSDAKRQALSMIHQYGGTEGDHHRAWLIDQVVRILADDYNEWVRKHNDGEDGPDTYTWDIGIAP